MAREKVESESEEEEIIIKKKQLKNLKKNRL